MNFTVYMPGVASGSLIALFAMVPGGGEGVPHKAISQSYRRKLVTGGPNPHLNGQVQAQVHIKTGSFELTFCWKKPEKFLVPHGHIRP